MDFLNQIDWHKHDGVHLDMINDVVRNQFYDNILKMHVKDKHCLEIGFGTGLLSMLALSHGAKSIVAYEANKDRYLLGQLMIRQLGLANKIQLIYGRYNHTTLLNHLNVEVVFSELVDPNLWCESLYNSLPRHPGVKFLPNEYFLNIHAVVIPSSLAIGLQHAPPFSPGFNPGVDIDNNFVKFINKIAFPEYQAIPEYELESGIIYFNYHRETQWGWESYIKLVSALGDVVAGYRVNAESTSITTFEFDNYNTTNIDFNIKQLKLTLDTSQWKNKTVLLVPKIGMAHNGYNLNLDSVIAWGPVNQPAIVVNPEDSITITHDVTTGLVEYKLH